MRTLTLVLGILALLPLAACSSDDSDTNKDAGHPDSPLEVGDGDVDEAALDSETDGAGDGADDGLDDGVNEEKSSP
ncbi:MAG: hypothetical protein FWD57_02455 [Polyangiaceae bacterium]|nr:hypothetical protein [Polyangiaceae bacterium]